MIVMLVVVGSGKMFRRPMRFICMFPGDLNRLKIGAPVKLSGVPSPQCVSPTTAGHGPRLPLFVNLSQTLESLNEISGELADYLQRNPAALVRGRYVLNQANE